MALGRHGAGIRAAIASLSGLRAPRAWRFVAISQFILGVTPSPVGLVIDPCIPESWKGYKVTRKFCGKLYSIDVKNPHRLSKGVKQMLVDGRVVQGNVIPLSPGSKLVHVVVELGG